MAARFCVQCAARTATLSRLPFSAPGSRLSARSLLLPSAEVPTGDPQPRSLLRKALPCEVSTGDPQPRGEGKEHHALSRHKNNYVTAVNTYFGCVGWFGFCRAGVALRGDPGTIPMRITCGLLTWFFVVPCNERMVTAKMHGSPHRATPTRHKPKVSFSSHAYIRCLFSPWSNRAGHWPALRWFPSRRKLCLFAAVPRVPVPCFSPAGSVGASAFGRGLHRRPAPLFPDP